jgi:hypothetical protein
MKELKDHLHFDKHDKCWEVDLVDTMRPKLGAEMSKKRFLSMWRCTRKHGVWPAVMEKFNKELAARTWITVSDMEKQEDNFSDNNPAGYITLDYALKKPDPDNPSARCGIRLVGDQSMSQNVEGERISFNHCVEAGDSRLTRLSDALNTFMFGQKVIIGDIEHAFFSIRNSPRLCSRSRFYFSTSNSFNITEAELVEYCQCYLTMGLLSSTNVLADVIQLSLEDRSTRETEWNLSHHCLY